MIRVPEVVRASFYQRLKDTGRRWIYGDSPADVETVYLRSLFSNFISSSPASMLAGLFLFFTAPVLPEGPIVGLWVSCHVVYHVIRMAVGLAYLRGTDFSAEQLRRWSLLSCGIQLIGGLLMLMLVMRSQSRSLVPVRSSHHRRTAQGRQVRACKHVCVRE